jgi:hypothetical protein
VNEAGPQRLALAVALASATALGDSAARADPVDPSYGRVEGDVTVAPGIGLAAGARGASLVGELRIRYLETAGVFAMYEDGSVVGSPAEPRRSLALGTEVRPLFLARYLQDLELRRAWIDLIVDSLGLDLGAVFAQPAGESFGESPGLQVGLGFGVPLAIRACGPWVGVRAGIRWSEDALTTGRVRGADDRSAYLAVLLVYEQLFMTHAVDVGDRRPE